MSLTCYAMLHNATILGKIFTHLPMHEILTSTQRVCRLWRNVVRDTDKIQKALFFRPMMDKALVYTPNEKGTSWFGRVGRSAEIFEHPLVSRTDTSLRKYYNKTIGGREDASWRKMLISQPPVRCCVVSKWNKGEMDEKFIVARGSGVTLGEIVEAFQQDNIFYMTIQGYQMWQPIWWTKEATWPLLEIGTKGVRRGKWREAKAEDDLVELGKESLVAANRSRVSADRKLTERYQAKKAADAERMKGRGSFGSSRKSGGSVE